MKNQEFGSSIIKIQNSLKNELKLEKILTCKDLRSNQKKAPKILPSNHILILRYW